MEKFRCAAAAGVALALAACHGTDATYSVGGDISFDTGTGTATLKLNGSNDVSVNGNGSFKFDHKLLTDETFNVQVVSVNNRCTVANGAGAMGKSNVTNVSVACTQQSSLNFTFAGIRSANLGGAQINPPVTTNATGVGGVILAPASLVLTGGVTVSGLIPTAVRIHQAPTGLPTGDGSAIINLVIAPDGLTAVVPANTAPLTLNQLASLLAGELYFNVTTALNPAGEIRGAIELQGGVAASVTGLDASQVRPIPPTSTATGTGTLLADQATGRILITYITHNVASTSAAGIHTATGPANVILFANLQSNLASPVAPPHLSAQNLADFANSLLYFEVDSLGNPNGEIRGNMSPQ